MFDTSPHSAAQVPYRMASVDITVVHAPACHFCADAEKALVEIAGRYPGRVRVWVVELESPEGAHLMVQHRPAMNPLVLIDGQFFSAGRLPRKKLTALLERTVGDDVPPVGR